jgi:iron complex outermembrane receptor protein
LDRHYPPETSTNNQIIIADALPGRIENAVEKGDKRMKRHGLIYRITLMTSAALCSVPMGTVAAQADEQASAAQSALSGEIVVTAQRREQNLQDVGIAIAAFSGDQLRTLNIVDSRELAALTPGVSTSGSLAGQNTQYTIRGVNQIDPNDIVEAPNAVYLDEGYIAIAQGQTFSLFDIDRVEILKGPQATLFGRNATGGLVHYITRKPNLAAVEGFVDLGYGLYDSPSTPGAFRGEAALNVPLTGTLAARAAVMWRKAEPYLKNKYPDQAVGGPPGPGAGADLGNDDTLGGRLTLLLEPSDSARFTLAFNGARSHLSTGPYQTKPVIAHYDANKELINSTDVEPGETRASIGANGQDLGSDLNNDGILGDTFGRLRPGGDLFGYIDPDGKDFTWSGDFAFANPGRVKTTGVNLTSEFDLSDNVSMIVVSDFKHFYKKLFVDADSGPENLAENYARVNADTFSQEARINGKSDSLEWIAGIYYLYIDNKSDNGLKFPVNSIASPFPMDLASVAHLKTNSYSGFGQIDWKFAPKFNLIVGGRIIREEKNYHFMQAIYPTVGSNDIQTGTPTIIGPAFGPSGPAPYDDNHGQTLWAGKLQLEYRPQDDLMLYAGVNRGVKAGSYNAQLAGGLGVPVDAIRYGPETLWSYEAGFKYMFPDRRTRFNASAFYYDYLNYQSFLFTGVSGVVINADARTYGGEAELFSSPLQGLDMGLMVSWFDSKVKDVPLRVNGPIVRDVKPVYAPQLQMTAIIRYAWDASFGGVMSVGADASYSSSYYYNLRNFDADKFGRYIMANANVSWAIDPFELIFSVKNLTDVRAGVQGYNVATLCGCNEVSYKPPRFFQISGRYKF